MDLPSRGAVDAPTLAALDLPPTTADELRALVDAAWESADPVLLELCRVRMATLLRHDAAVARRSPPAVAAGLSEAKLAALPQWPTSPLFSSDERACLAFAEQLAIDVTGITAGHVDALHASLPPGDAFGFVAALAILEQAQRFELTLERLLE